MDILAHGLVGFIIATIFPVLNPLFVVLGSMILDLDHALSYMIRYLKQDLKFYPEELNSIQKVIYASRTPAHSVWGALILIGLTYFVFSQIAAISIMVGLLVHLFIDSIDKAGIKWLWPYMHLKGFLPVAVLDEDTVDIKGFKRRTIILNVVLIIVLIYLTKIRV